MLRKFAVGEKFKCRKRRYTSKIIKLETNYNTVSCYQKYDLFSHHQSIFLVY